jgi:hypothetical protein
VAGESLEVAEEVAEFLEVAESREAALVRKAGPWA